MYNIQKNDYTKKDYTKQVQTLIDFYLSHNGSDYSYVWKWHRTQGLKTDGNRVRLNDGNCDTFIPDGALKEFARVWRDNGYFISTCIDDKFGYRCFAFTKFPYTAYNYRQIDDLDKFIS
jgi:hypothetical protein